MSTARQLDDTIVRQHFGDPNLGLQPLTMTNWRCCGNGWSS